MFKQNRKKLEGRKMDKNAGKTSGFWPDFPPDYESWTLSLTFPNLCSPVQDLHTCIAGCHSLFARACSHLFKYSRSLLMGCSFLCWRMKFKQVFLNWKVRKLSWTDDYTLRLCVCVCVGRLQTFQWGTCSCIIQWYGWILLLHWGNGRRNLSWQHLVCILVILFWMPKIL